MLYIYNLSSYIAKCKSKERFTNIDIKIQNIEAFGNNEDGGDDPCKAPGGVCMTYDKDGDPIFHIGLSIP